MKKWIFVSTGIFIIVAIILFAVLISKLGPIILDAVNNYGPKITGTTVRLKGVDISVFGASAILKDFHLGNPYGFTSPEAMSVSSIKVELDKRSIGSDTIKVDRVELIGPVITYEKKGKTDNFKTIIDNMKKEGGTYRANGKEPERKTGQKKILIKYFIIKNGKINVVISGLMGHKISASLPDFQLKDIGAGENGASPADAFGDCLKGIYQKITFSAYTATGDAGSDIRNKDFSVPETLKRSFNK